MTVGKVPGGTVFHLSGQSEDYYLKAKVPIIHEGKEYYALTFDTGQPAFTKDELNQEVEISSCVFTQKSRT